MKPSITPRRMLKVSCCGRGSDLPLRHPGQAHALTLTFATGEEGRIVAPCVGGTQAADGEAWIERQSGGRALLSL
jgi:hypothetical protein